MFATASETTTKGVPLNGVCIVVAADFATRSQLKLPTEPVEPLASIAMRRTCLPPERTTPLLVTVDQFCHPPVFGTPSEPVLFTPPTSAWNFPPAAAAARRKV